VSATTVRRQPLGLTSAVAFLIVVLGETYRQNLGFGNVSGLLALALAIVCLAASRRKWNLAAIVLAASLCLKPILLPALLVFVMWRRWRALATCLGLTAAANLVALAIVPRGDQFFTKALPFLLRDAHPPKVDPYISTLAAQGRLLHIDGGVVLALRIATIVCAALVILIVRRDHPVPSGVAIVTVAGTGLLAQYVAGTGTEFHYVLALIPLLISAGVPRGYLPLYIGIPAGLALAWLVDAPASWYPDLTPFFGQLAATSGIRLAAMLLVLVALTISSLLRRPTASRRLSEQSPEDVTLPGLSPATTGQA
jgi:arabinofuranan 3-O-arabinosyltransferase